MNKPEFNQMKLFYNGLIFKRIILKAKKSQSL